MCAGSDEPWGSGVDELALAVAPAAWAVVEGRAHTNGAFAFNGSASVTSAAPAAGESAESAFICDAGSAPTEAAIGAGSFGSVIRAGGTRATRSEASPTGSSAQDQSRGP